MVDLAVEGLGTGELIGGGASSTVFAATRLAFGDRVAVKVLKQTLTDVQSRTHFEREARALAELADIPGVVAVLASGVNTRGEPYLVLPLFQDSAQGDVNVNGAMDPFRAARMVAAAARAVHGGHERGVIHRDLKPANLLLTKSDDIFVSDFGIAKLTDSSVSASGWLGLTPAYAPPEALEGLPAGAQGDVYSLGATLAALVIGAPPFSSTGSESPIALLNRVVNEPAPDLVAYGAPPALAAAVVRSMAKDPAARYQSALELAQALELVIANDDAVTAELPLLPVPVLAPAPPLVAPVYANPAPAIPPSEPPTGSSMGSKRLLVIGAGLAVVVAAVVGGVVAFAMRSGDDTTTTTAAPTGVVVEQPTTASAAEPTADQPPAATAVVEPSVAPTASVPTATAVPPEPALPAATVGGPIDVYPDGSGEAPTLASAVARARDGDVIRLAAGRYEIADIIRVESDITIIGAGIGETELVGIESPGVFVFQETAARLRNLSVTSTVQGTVEDNLGLIEVNLSPAMVIDSVEVSQSPGFGIAVIGSTIKLTNSNVVSSRLTGVGIGDGSNVEVTGTTSSDNGESGFVIFDGSQAVFMKTESMNNGLAGYSVQGAGAPQFVANIATDNSTSGFQFTTAATPTLRGNGAMNNAESGFAWFDTAAGTAIGNRSEGNTLAGFAMNGESSPTVTANTAIGNGESGFVWADSASGAVAGNRSDTNGLNGYAVVNSGAPELRGNVASGNSQGDVFAADGTLAVIDETGIIRVELDGTGDTADIETAVARARNGDVIRIGEGVHQLAESVSVTKDLTLVGSGAALTTVEVTGHNTVFLIENTPIRVLDMTITTSLVTNSDDNRFSAMEIDGSSDFTVDGVAIRNSIGIGLGIFDSTGTVSNTQVTASFWSGIGLSENAQVIMSNVAATGNGQSGFVFFEEASGKVGGNVADGNMFFGFSVQGSGSPEFTGNAALNNQGSGFAASETASPTHVGNVSRENDEAGYIWFDDASGFAISNTAEGNVTSGFNVSDSASPSLTSNDSNGNQVDGFTWFGTSTGTAVGNTASGNVFDGFAAEGESTPTLERNVARDNERRAFHQSDEASPTLTNNEFG